nr:uncharacterized protein LOC112210136 [Halyomorpha halys]
MMAELKKTFPRPRHFQRLYSGFGIDDHRPSEQFCQSLWQDKPRICIVDLIDSFREKKVESSSTVDSSKTKVDVDFTNSRQFSLGKWQKNDFFKLNKCNGGMFPTCSRHYAHMKHLENFDSTRLKTNRRQKITRKTKKVSQVST